MSKVDITNATVNILITVNGEVHLVAMAKDEYETVTFLAKKSVETLVRTGRSQAELNEFLNYER